MLPTLADLLMAALRQFDGAHLLLTSCYRAPWRSDSCGRGPPSSRWGTWARQRRESLPPCWTVTEIIQASLIKSHTLNWQYHEIPKNFLHEPIFPPSSTEDILKKLLGIFRLLQFTVVDFNLILERALGLDRWISFSLLHLHNSMFI